VRDRGVRSGGSRVRPYPLKLPAIASDRQATPVSALGVAWRVRRVVAGVGGHVSDGEGEAGAERNEEVWAR
jgi:hypothetical protein